MKMRVRILCAILGVCVLAPSLPARAGQASGVITNLIVRDADGLVYVYLSGAPSGRPACASATVYWMIRDENSETGKKTYAALLAAQLAGRNVTIYGANTCLRWGDGEDISGVVVS